MTREEGYQEALRRIEEARITGATELDLSELQLESIPVELKSCQTLQTLNLFWNRIPEIENLPKSLLTLDLGVNRIREIVNLPHSLQTLDLRANQIGQIVNLPKSLQELNLGVNQIREIVNLPKSLQRLDLALNRIPEIVNLPDNLQTLDLRANGIREITNLPNGLQELNLGVNQIREIVNLPKSLQKLHLYSNPTRNIPPELLGQEEFDNCLNNVRAWFADLEKEPMPNRIVKFMVSGNSNTGKSSLIEALIWGRAQAEQDSTHGIRIEPLRMTDGVQQVDGIAFDFGGQEIYHGTHQLFLRSRAVQLVVFDAETEATTVSPDRRGKLGETNRNKTLSNWIDDLDRLSPESAFVLVQNKLELQIPLPVVTQSLINQQDDDPAVWTSRVSAWTGRNIASLRGTLIEAAQILPEYGMDMPRSWLAVRKYFLDNSQKVLTERRRLVTRVFFDQLCKDHDVLPGSEFVLLYYLHNTGLVYYDANYLDDAIIADQQWAIEAIYQVLDRQGRLYDELANESYGKKRLKYLFGYFKQGYTYDQRKLFVAMMESCGLCFPLIDEADGQVNDDTYYLFPQFLPDTRPDVVNYFLDDRASRIVFTQQLTFLPYYHI